MESMLLVATPRFSVQCAVHAKSPSKVFDLELVPPHSKQLLAELAEEQYHVHKEVQQCRAKFISVRKRNPALYHNIQNITLEVPDIVAEYKPEESSAVQEEFAELRQQFADKAASAVRELMEWKLGAAEAALMATQEDFKARIVQHILEIRRHDSSYYRFIDDDFTAFMELVIVHQNEEVPDKVRDQYATDAGFILEHLDKILKAHSYKAATQDTLGRPHVRNTQKKQQREGEAEARSGDTAQTVGTLIAKSLEPVNQQINRIASALHEQGILSGKSAPPANTEEARKAKEKTEREKEKKRLKRKRRQTRKREQKKKEEAGAKGAGEQKKKAVSFTRGGSTQHPKDNKQAPNTPKPPNSSSYANPQTPTPTQPRNPNPPKTQTSGPEQRGQPLARKGLMPKSFAPHHG